MKNKTLKIQENNFDQIEDIMLNFDFKKVHDYMVLTKWTWTSYQGEVGIPTIERIKFIARECLEAVAEQGLESRSIGGFTARRSCGGFGGYRSEPHEGLVLLFYIESHQSFSGVSNPPWTKLPHLKSDAE